MPRPSTFVPLAEPTHAIMRRFAFLKALDVKRPDFSLVEPPVDALPGACSDENHELAKIFRMLSGFSTATDRIAHLTAAITVHQHRLELQIRHAKSTASYPFRAEERSAHVEARHVEQMIETLFGWLDALFDQACEVTE